MVVATTVRKALNTILSPAGCYGKAHGPYKEETLKGEYKRRKEDANAYREIGGKSNVKRKAFAQLLVVSALV